MHGEQTYETLEIHEILTFWPVMRIGGGTALQQNIPA